ncbi:MAG: HAMP domain-containing histidine kinase [Caulobacteraceae bacterium]|nr:HAMP domain-containing histidine kinase [Caulobacteraceae bacterium]
MQTPVLALTLGRRAARAGLSPEAVSAENMRLLAQLRWVAVAGQLLTVGLVHFALGIALPLAPMLGVVGLLVLANLAVLRVVKRRRITQGAIFLALLFDVVALALQLYLSGGAENPFISLFFLQVVLGAILLDAAAVGVLAAAAVAAYAILANASLPLAYPAALAASAAALERLGAWISFALTGTLLAVFITRIIRNLRARDIYLAELRRAAVEEDGIVRMGLLASGAAHELGTPLSSLSVILNDWSRMPRLTGDAELGPELAEMQREVARCKAILGDLLHSAGAPRMEELSSVLAGEFLDGAVAEWRLIQPSVPLTYRAEGLEGAVLAAEPALRQAIDNILDNAAEVSPSGVTLAAARTAEGLEISVADAGPGFTAAQLASVGTPLQSTKGAGRGLGLFLAAALARRLGGRLTAANRPGGGAVVRLVLPLANDRAAEA